MSSETDILPPEIETLDEDDRLAPEFVRSVLGAVDDGHDAEAYRLAQPLHAADIADLFELTPREDRAALAKSLGDLINADVSIRTE